MPTSPEYQGEPVPSMMCPLLMTMSKSCGGAAKHKYDQNKISPSLNTCDLKFLLAIGFSIVASDESNFSFGLFAVPAGKFSPVISREL
jgi:hypothetical protein